MNGLVIFFTIVGGWLVFNGVLRILKHKDSWGWEDIAIGVFVIIAVWALKFYLKG